MNKSAREMFEELGYKYENGDKYIRCIWQPKNKRYSRIITFDKKNKKFTPYNQVQFNMQLLQAINQQCKELGWLDD